MASCVECYKDEKGWSGQEEDNYLKKTGAVGFITSGWECLHTTSPQYVNDSIDDYIKNHEGV